MAKRDHSVILGEEQKTNAANLTKKKTNNFPSVSILNLSHILVNRPNFPKGFQSFQT